MHEVPRPDLSQRHQYRYRAMRLRRSGSRSLVDILSMSLRRRWSASVDPLLALREGRLRAVSMTCEHGNRYSHFWTQVYGKFRTLFVGVHRVCELVSQIVWYVEVPTQTVKPRSE